MPIEASNNQRSLPSILGEAHAACPQGAQYWFGLLSTDAARVEREGVDAMKRALERTCRQLIRKHGASRDRINDACRRVAAAINDWEAKKTPSEDASPESAKAAPIERNLGQRRYRRRSSRPFVATL